MFRGNIARYGCSLCCASLYLISGTAFGADSLSTARDSVAQWVQTQQLISRTRAEWESDKEMLQQTQALLERDLKQVQEQLGRFSTNNAVADQERLKAESELKVAVEALETAKGLVQGLETELKALTPLFPPPLRLTVDPLLNRLPANPQDTKAGITERLQTVVGVLNEVDKFNNTIAVSNEKQPNEKGELVAVDVLYLGLGQAFYVASSGDLAGVGVPGAEGWKWTPNAALAGPIRDAVAMYRNQKPAAFLALPVSVQ